ncbi:carboxypeptidase Y-deficient [Saitoella coloradoensis]
MASTIPEFTHPPTLDGPHPLYGDAHLKQQTLPGMTPVPVTPPRQQRVLSSKASTPAPVEYDMENPNARNAVTGWYPLHHAAYRGEVHIVRELLEAGADVNAVDKESETALMKAVLKCHPEVVKELLNHDADVRHADKDGWTALHIAASNGNLEITRDLTAHGVDLGAKTRGTGYTPLMTAASRGHHQIIAHLLSLPSVPVNATNALHESAYDIAASGADLYACALLSAAGDNGGVYEPVIVWEHARWSFTHSNAKALRMGDPAHWSTTLASETKVRKEEIELPQPPTPESAQVWSWVTEWSIDKSDPRCTPDGWLFARNFQVEEKNWTSDLPREKGWVCARRWVRVMKRRVEGVPNAYIDAAQNEADERERRGGYGLKGLLKGLRKDHLRQSMLGGTDDEGNGSNSESIFDVRSGVETPPTSLEEVAAAQRDGDEDGCGSQGGEDDDAEDAERLREMIIETADSGGGSGSSRNNPSQPPVQHSSSTPGAPQSYISSHHPFHPPHGAYPTITNLDPSRRPPWQPDDEAPHCHLCSRPFTFFLRRHHCRLCGRVVCDDCSDHRMEVSLGRVVREPWAAEMDGLMQALGEEGATERVRVCDQCWQQEHSAALNLPPVGGISMSAEQVPIQEVLAEDVDEMTLAEADEIGSGDGDGEVLRHGSAREEVDEGSQCPICARPLTGTDEEKEAHVRDCIEGNMWGSPSRRGGTHGVSGHRYLVYTLRENNPIEGHECVICFEEFEVGDTVARLECLCSYHRTCIRQWLDTQNSGCPVHALRS